MGLLRGEPVLPDQWELLGCDRLGRASHNAHPGELLTRRRTTDPAKFGDPAGSNRVVRCCDNRPPLLRRDRLFRPDGLLLYLASPNPAWSRESRIPFRGGSRAQVESP